MSVTIANLGFPRIGPHRELKFALESFWGGRSSETELKETAASLRRETWLKQKNLGIDYIPSNDFSFYDHVLDTTVMLGAVPERYGFKGGKVDLATYFAMARGTTSAENSVTAMEMTKWFDTNYHYMVPELVKGQKFSLASTKVLDLYNEAKEAGIETRPVILGPVTWLSLAKGRDVDSFDYLDDVLAIYTEVLTSLAKAGAKWVQIDEPALVLDLNDKQRAAYKKAYDVLSKAGPSLMLTSYFGRVAENMDLVTSLPVAGLHVDLIRGSDDYDTLLLKARPDTVLSLGVIDGRNIWRADLDALVDWIEPLAEKYDLVLAPSCSLLHVPVDLKAEKKIDPEITQWLAFAQQKLEELAVLKTALNKGRNEVAKELAASTQAAKNRQSSPRIHNEAVTKRLAAITPDMAQRRNPYPKRAAVQQKGLNLPLYPTTTIGSFPQTLEVRQARAKNRRGELDDAGYTQFLREQTAATIRWQEEIGLDVLVHGEFERNDMVQYFGEQLNGFAFTNNGWVQSYGSRCVRPPILFGDVTRPKAMTVDWWSFSQKQSKKPVKGMLTGPVTILNWSFVRNDQPRSVSCRQLALAIRDEVVDLETAGAKIIQIDEAALREGLPLRRAEWQTYLDWAVESFRLTASGVRDDTQIHSHMCYSEFNDILPSIAAMDADALSIETARSQMELLQAFASYQYPNQIGPGVYDIHSPRIPSVEEMVNLLRLARKHLPADRLWVNPDCGLKTRRWEEVKPSLLAMVAAAKEMRKEEKSK
ncbi:MAG: 5-methyltetrahydropteroyltriglutamate--homocysteine S-methyltransferase [Zymomonas mobilis]|uniref:5-methyltetrahydropteroyltriglutamate--homocysteine methyltransferase n=1 Tax=Zymomonas mobilis TaxID=542 RepID=A0A542W1D6_ZYMMB|nr:5-methyltetrahydropteroyltriglutamate--homocysteine S-methyltransferase [Zymomonas mobilis]TQL17400.1 methionine synthase (B12-independent) [Zymomonas mobilis]